MGVKVGLGILQITSAKRCPQVWPWLGRSLFSTNFVEFDKRCHSSNQQAEIFMNETNMRRFESVFTNRITPRKKTRLARRKNRILPSLNGFINANTPKVHRSRSQSPLHFDIRNS